MLYLSMPRAYLVVLVVEGGGGEGEGEGGKGRGREGKGKGREEGGKLLLYRDTAL